MWCEGQARAPLATQIVLLSSAPYAVIGTRAGTGSARLAGTYPRERRSISGPERRRAHHRVVGADVDRPVVADQQIGDPVQALARVVVAVGDRLVGHVGAGHDQRRADLGQQQVVQRRVRQHHAQVGRARRHRVGHGGVRAAAGDHDRALAPGQQLLLPGRQLHQRPGAVQIARHQRERLVLAVLARAQRRRGGLVVGAARQVVPAQALQRHHLPAVQAAATSATRQRELPARTPGRRWAGRGSAGRPGRRTRPGRPAHMAKPAMVVSGRS